MDVRPAVCRGSLPESPCELRALSVPPGSVRLLFFSEGFAWGRSFSRVLCGSKMGWCLLERFVRGGLGEKIIGKVYGWEGGHTVVQEPGLSGIPVAGLCS